MRLVGREAAKKRRLSRMRQTREVDFRDFAVLRPQRLSGRFRPVVYDVIPYEMQRQYVMGRD